MKLEPKRRKELITRFIELNTEMCQIAREIKSPIMEERILEMGESFYKRMSKDKNLPKDRDIEAEMDDDSGDEEENE